MADAAHFTRAAQTLYVSQPTLSQQIKQLEDELGTPLFHRGAGGVQLTAAGEKFRPFAERVLREMEDAVAALGEDDAASGGEVRVGALEGVASYLLPEVVARAVSQSRLEVVVETLPALELGWAVARGEIDLGVGDSPVTSLNAEPLYDENLALFVPPGHRLGTSDRARIADLENVGLFCLSRPSPLRALLDDAMERTGIAVRPLAQFPHADAVLRAALAAKTPTVLPLPMLRDAQEHGAAKGWRLVALTNPRPHRTVALLRRKSRDENPAARAFAAHLSAVVGELLKPE